MERLLLWRYLAESNCSTRFCRPLPNRSAKVPFFITECKGRLLFLFPQIFVAFSFFRMAFSVSFTFTVKPFCFFKVASGTAITWIFSMFYSIPYHIYGPRHSNCQNEKYNDNLPIHVITFTFCKDTRKRFITMLICA